MDREDVYLWPDGDWCFADNLGEYGWKSDDYRRVSFGTPEWDAVVNEKAANERLRKVLQIIAEQAEVVMTPEEMPEALDDIAGIARAALSDDFR
jgi:hypothetical protein